MPRATGPAADAATPKTPDPPSEPTQPEVPPAPAGWGTWRYTGDLTRIYTNVPVTVSPGDVISWPQMPALDGFWEPAGSDTPITRWPDNQPNPPKGV